MKYCLKSTFLIVLGIAFLVACSSKKTNPNDVSTDAVSNPATASGDGDTTAYPAFNFVEETHDFGKIKQGEKVSYNFRFKNSGKSDLVISNATASCGCTVPEYSKKPIAPGEESFITVTFDSNGKEGKIFKTITLSANTMPNTHVLNIACDITVSDSK